jgi:hypothetical protein
MEAKKSPFHRPDDKDVFLARDTQKQKRIEAKEKAKNLRIWDKKTATSRLPLKRFRDADLPPSDSGKRVIVFNNGADKDLIDAAKNICKERVQFPKDQRSQNAYEFIEQKKEMFLVQLSHNTIKKEIDMLQTKIERKAKAMEQSKRLLNEDERDVRNYVEENNKTTKQIEEDSEKAQKLRKEKEEKLKNIEAEITALNYQSSKNNQDTLETLESHKKFLEELSDQDFLKRKYETQRQKIEILKNKWIKWHKDNVNEDHIIFAEEIEAHDNEIKNRDAGRAQDGATRDGYGRGDTKFKRPEMSEKDWEAKFQF